MKKIIAIILLLCIIGSAKIYSSDIVRIDQSGSSVWGTAMVTPYFVTKNLHNYLDSLPSIDSVVYERIGTDFYKRIYYPEYSIIYNFPEDSLSLDADSIAFQIQLDSLNQQTNILTRRINRLRDRIQQEAEELRATRQKIRDLMIENREMLITRRRYYRILDRQNARQ